MVIDVQISNEERTANREKRLKGEKNRVMSGRKLQPLIQPIKSKHSGFQVAYDPLSADVIQTVD